MGGPVATGSAGRNRPYTRSQLSTLPAALTAQRLWVLDADLTAAFHRIDHDHLLATIGCSRERNIRGWLKAGVFEAGKGFAPTAREPLKAVFHLAFCVRTAWAGRSGRSPIRTSDPARTKRGSPAVEVYADDGRPLPHQATGRTGQGALAGWLAPRGLTFNEDKTRIVHLDDGFDFLGFTIRRTPAS